MNFKFKQTTNDLTIEFWANPVAITTSTGQILSLSCLWDIHFNGVNLLRTKSAQDTTLYTTFDKAVWNSIVIVRSTSSQDEEIYLNEESVKTISE